MKAENASTELMSDDCGRMRISTWSSRYRFRAAEVVNADADSALV